VVRVSWPWAFLIVAVSRRHRRRDRARNARLDYARGYRAAQWDAYWREREWDAYWHRVYSDEG
jgi:hypothetical protein